MKVLFLPPPRDKLFEDKGIFRRIHISDLGEVTSFDYPNIDEAITAYFGAYEAQTRKDGVSKSAEDDDGIKLKFIDRTVMFEIYEHDFKNLCLKARKKVGLDNNAKCYDSGAYWAMLGIYEAFDTGLLPKDSGEGLKKTVFSQYVTLRDSVEAQLACERKSNALRVILSEQLSEVVIASRSCPDSELINMLLCILDVCLGEKVTSKVIRKNREGKGA